MMLSFSFLFFLCLLFYMLFFASKKQNYWDVLSSSSFECGFSSWFFSRFSFSIHYFLVALIFLFLDLELCLMFPFLFTSSSSMEINFSLVMFLVILFLGLLIEWAEGKLDWIF